jgi:threonine/homoserine/homoserine lactone efflux protein
MKIVKNILVGFLISFVGSIPLGYLNIIGFEIYKQQGISATIFYLLGVIFIELFVIYFTLIFVNKVAFNVKWTKYIEVFSIVFMFVLAYVFYANATKTQTHENEFSHFGYWGSFVTGLFLSCLNFVQIPFWAGWNLYLLNGKYIEISGKRKYFYVLGTIIGTFVGMLALILSLHFLAVKANFLSKYITSVVIPLFFIGLGIFQLLRFFKKYFR